MPRHDLLISSLHSQGGGPAPADPSIVRRIAGTSGFIVLPRRWVVERTLGRLGRWRRLSKDYEQLPEVSEAMVTLAMIRLMLHRIAHPNRRRLSVR